MKTMLDREVCGEERIVITFKGGLLCTLGAEAEKKSLLFKRLNFKQ